MKTLRPGKIGIFIFLGYITFSSLSAVSFVAAGAEHDCTHCDHCSGCIQLECALELFKQFNTSVLKPLVIGALDARVFSERLLGFSTVSITPVVLKVRINT
jgi:hypothetical protein